MTDVDSRCCSVPAYLWDPLRPALASILHSSKTGNELAPGCEELTDCAGNSGNSRGNDSSDSPGNEMSSDNPGNEMLSDSPGSEQSKYKCDSPGTERPEETGQKTSSDNPGNQMSDIPGNELSPDISRNEQSHTGNTEAGLSGSNGHGNLGNQMSANPGNEMSPGISCEEQSHNLKTETGLFAGNGHDSPGIQIPDNAVNQMSANPGNQMSDNPVNKLLANPGNQMSANPGITGNGPSALDLEDAAWTTMAADELHEKPEWNERDCQALRSIVQGEYHQRNMTDVRWYELFEWSRTTLVDLHLNIISLRYQDFRFDLTL
jgi:hypothetical protein